MLLAVFPSYVDVQDETSDFAESSIFHGTITTQANRQTHEFFPPVSCGAVCEIGSELW